jgi:hypothetical protein
VAKDVAGVVVGAKIMPDGVKENPLHHQHDEQNCLVPEQIFFESVFIRVHLWLIPLLSVS